MGEGGAAEEEAEAEEENRPKGIVAKLPGWEEGGRPGGEIG